MWSLRLGTASRALYFPRLTSGAVPLAGAIGWRLRGCPGAPGGRSGNFFHFFSQTPLRGSGGFDKLCTRSPPPRGRDSILEKRWCQERGPDGRSPDGDPPEGTRNTREEMLVRAGAERSRREEQTFFF